MSSVGKCRWQDLPSEVVTFSSEAKTELLFPIYLVYETVLPLYISGFQSGFTKTKYKTIQK